MAKLSKDDLTREIELKCYDYRNQKDSRGLLANDIYTLIQSTKPKHVIESESEQRDFQNFLINQGKYR